MIYICIPTHDEQQTVGVVLWKLRQVLTDFPRDYQLLVADDASTDKTPEVLEPYTRVLPLTVIRSESRQGFAASLEMLLREAVRRSEYPKRDVIVSLQADFSEEPDDLVPLVKRIEAGADVAVGNKVSTSKETRTRRFARSLASFFMRRQKWPEGVMTPFDGYRAYRLYAVKRALEDRAGARVVRHDGWAGHAELLRAVLPHARRVDVVDIDDRPDRLQRPRREKPFAAAMQVRVMATGTEPERLVGVEELDRIAMTASRSRERSAITAQSLHAARGSSAARTNGSRSRTATGARRDQVRSGSTSNGAGRNRAEAGESKPVRSPAGSSEGRTRQKSGEARSGRARTKKAEGSRRKPGTKKPAAEATADGVPDATENVVTDATAQGTGQEVPTKPKRKRRRRKRGGQGAATAQQDAQDTAQPGTVQEKASQPDVAQPDASQPNVAQPDASQPNASQPNVAQSDASQPDASKNAGQERATTPEANAESTSDEAAGSDTSATGDKKRRRRGGRRGGRGRRKPRSQGAAEGGSASEGEEREVGTPRAEQAGQSAERPLAEPVARVESD